MGDRKTEDQFKIDLDRVVSDPNYRREILRRLHHDHGPTHYRPKAPAKRGPVVSVPEPPRKVIRKRGKPDAEPGGDD